MLSIARKHLLTLLCPTALMLYGVEAHADWGELFIAPVIANSPAPAVRNVDTMALPDGTIGVGYYSDNLPRLSFVATDLTIQTISSSFPTPVALPRFEADRFGIVSFSESSPLSSQSPRFGSDFGSRTAIESEANQPMINLLGGTPGTPIVDIALDSRGVPTLVAEYTFNPGFGFYLISRFDIPTAQWALNTYPAGINMTAPGANTVAAYTPEDRLVIAGADRNQFELTIEESPGNTFVISEASTTLGPAAGISIATRDDIVAYAFPSTDGLGTTVGLYDGIVPVYETLPGQAYVAPGGLNYAPDGTLWLTYVDQATGDVMFSQRTAPGTWDTEALGIDDGIAASLEFTDDGTPYIGVATLDGVALYSPAFFSFVLGDMNGDGALTNGDIAPFVQALTDPAGYAAAFPGLDPDLLGDFTGDGSLTNGDIAGIVNALTSPTPVPEPASLAMLALAGLIMDRRRPR